MIRTAGKQFRSDPLKGLQLVQLIRYASFFAIGIVLVKAGLSKYQIGHFETLTFVAGALSFFWITGIIQALLPLYGDENRKTETLFSTFVLLTVFSFLVGLILLLSGNLVSQLTGKDLPSDLVWLIALYILFNGPASLLEYVYLLRKQARRLFWYGWIAFGVQFLLVGLAALLRLPFNWILTALVLSSGVRWIWLLVELSSSESLKVSWLFIRKNLALGAPIMVSVLLSGSAQYIDGLIINGYFDQAVFAVFRYGARELPVVALLAHALSNAIVPVIHSEGPVAGLRQLRSRSSSMANWLFPLTLLFMVLSYLIFPLIYDAGFVDSARVFNVYLLLIISRLLFPQSLLLAFKKTRILMYVSGLELLTNVVLSILFVRIWGIVGVAWATVIAYLFERIVLFVL